jgi:hypothetical protein
VDVVVEEKPAVPFFQPPTEEKVQLMERMVKALPEGETAGGTAEAMSPGGASDCSAVLR